MTQSRSAASQPAKGLNSASLGFAEDFVPTGEVLKRARENSVLVGAPTPSNGVCTALTFLARVLDAKAVVEIGTGTGVTGLALFAGMNPNGILTSIDAEAGWQLDAKSAFTDAGIPSQRYRLIAGLPLDVAPKLRDGAYDLVFIDGDKLEYVEYIAQALRLLRHGGALVLNEALWQNMVADSRNEDDETVIIREALQSVSDTEEFTSLLIPLGGGLLAAVKD